jgi:hypothetical protein
MIVDEFEKLLLQLKDADWQAVTRGQSVLIVDDCYLQIGPADAENACLAPPEGEVANDITALRCETLKNAEKLLTNFYLTHALTARGFRYQVEGLFEIHGPCAFATVQDALPDRTLFVEGGEVIAEGAGSPRHRYGVYCELDHDMDQQTCEAFVRQWLECGDAHEQYLGMNVCRYNC